MPASYRSRTTGAVRRGSAGRSEEVSLAVTPLAGRGGEGDRREPRPVRSGCHRGPGSTFRSSPMAGLLEATLDDGDSRRSQPGSAWRGHRALESRSSPTGLQGQPRVPRPRAVPGQGRTQPPDRPEGRTPGRWPGPIRRGRSGGYGPSRWAAAGSGCSRTSTQLFQQHYRVPPSTRHVSALQCRVEFR